MILLLEKYDICNNTQSIQIALTSMPYNTSIIKQKYLEECVILLNEHNQIQTHEQRGI